MRALTLGLFCVVLSLPAEAQLPAVRPARAGFSPERLERLHAFVQRFIDEGKHAGAVTVIARNGRLVDFQTYGWRDLEARQPMERGTIFRIYSMTKVITSAAVLQLYEQGRFDLDEPASRFLPELKEPRVLAGGTPEQPELVPAARPITIKHLLTHTAGFAYDFSAPEPLRAFYRKADLLEAPTSREFMRRLSEVPLAHSPGDAYLYGVNTDVLGVLVEAVSGLPLEEYLERHLFRPLGMKDTFFDVPESKRGRVAQLYGRGPDGKLRVVPPPYGSYMEPGRAFASGGGGLFSTPGDYLRFAQMLLNGGHLDGKRILGRKTVELMMANHLTSLPEGRLPGSAWEGFGLGGSVRLDLAKANAPGSVGQFGWGGAATTLFNIDPKERTVAMVWTQHIPYNQHGLFSKFFTLYYSALAD